MAHDTTESRRLESDPAAWRRWGPYLSERAWGTVREDYSEHGQAWEAFPHDHARSRTYRWSEDGLAGICDLRQFLCFSLAFWNGKDPILKERIFGLTGNEGNHGEDAKEYWSYLDCTPTHSFMVWRYLYPQSAFPYDDLLQENRRRSKLEPEYELVDTGIFDAGYWEITATYAKADADDLCIAISLHNAGPETATLDVLPTLWFRNTWSWGRDPRKPMVVGDQARMDTNHFLLGKHSLVAEPSAVSQGVLLDTLCCDNETNAERLFGVASSTGYPKDGIGDHVLHGTDTVNPDRTGTKGALHYRVTVEAGATAEIRLRLSPDGRPVDDSWHSTMADRRREADEFYAALTPEDASTDEAAVLRQAFSGMLWSKQFYHYNVTEWLDGDPSQPTPPAARLEGRNHDWWHLNNRDVISMPDKWEYPWYAAWDLAFHCVTLAHVDAGFAKNQLLLMGREWYMHPNGQMPAYEWAFGDVNPPVHAWAALRVFEIDGSKDFDFLERALHKLLLNFNWWVNRKDAEGNNIFEGGFLGLDNIGPIDRSAQLPVAGTLEQSDGTAWMATYCLNMLEISLVLAKKMPVYEDLATKFFEHFAYIAGAMYERGLWNEADGFYYDVYQVQGGDRVPLRVRSIVGLIPLYATMVLQHDTIASMPEFSSRVDWFVAHQPRFAEAVAHLKDKGADETRLLAVVSPDRLERILTKMLDEGEFLSPYGLRALAASHREHPFVLELGGMSSTVDYEPAESTSGLFGGNSNWRGPIWFPVNYLVIESLKRYATYTGDDVTVELPTGSSNRVTLAEVADNLSRRLIGLFVDGPEGRRPVFGEYERLQSDPIFHRLIPFHEYFHGDTGAGLGASHQTGWTGLVAHLIVSRASNDEPPVTMPPV